jgi:CheY-like chemotaxis protein
MNTVTIDGAVRGAMMPKDSVTRILLVDDTPTNLKVLSEAVRNQGWTTLIATDGESAIDQAEYAQPSLILLQYPDHLHDGPLRFHQ